MLLPKMRKIPVFHRKREVDWLGGVLLMASAVVFMLVLTWGGNRFLWLSPTIIAMLGVVGRAGFRPSSGMPEMRASRSCRCLLLGGSVVPYAMTAGGCAMGAMIGLTVHLPLYYEVVYHLTASEAGLALIPLAAVSTCGAAIAGKTMARAKHYKRVAIIGMSVAALVGCVFTFATLPLWGLLALLALFALGLGTGVSDQRGLAAERGGAGAGRHRHRRDEFLPRADGVVHGGGIQHHPADGARRRYLAGRRASRSRQFDFGPRHDRRVPLCVRAPPRCCWPPDRSAWS